MELIKKNIHMDHKKCGTVTQMTLDDDRNVPDKNPDVEEILLKKAAVRMEEIKATADHVLLRGKLQFQMLYATDDWEKGLSQVSGEIPFEEQVYLECVTKEDQVTVTPVIDDLTIGKINSRKINVQAVITFTLTVSELIDVEAPVELQLEGLFEDGAVRRAGNIGRREEVEYEKKELHTTTVCISKNDIFRIKEELEIPAAYPNIDQLIWESVKLENMTFKPMEGKIGVQGELRAFYLFTGENDDMPVRYYSTVVPIRGEMDCNGCEAGMIPMISYELEPAQTEVRPDYDGENRLFGIDMVLNLRIRMLCDESFSMITDMYGITGEVQLATRTEQLQSLLMQNEGTYKVSEHITRPGIAGKIMQLIHSEADARIFDSRMTENGIEADGMLEVTTIYVTGEDDMPYGVIHGNIPFREVVDIPSQSQGSRIDYQLTCVADDVSVTMADGESVDVKALIHIKATAFEQQEVQVITHADIGAQDYEKMERLPGMAVVVFEKGERLWDIGKRYCQPLSRIRAINGLPENGEPKEGSRIMIINHMM